VDPDPGDLPGFLSSPVVRPEQPHFKPGKVEHALTLSSLWYDIFSIHRAALILTTPIGMPHTKKQRFSDSARGPLVCG
jgi:hypothetical protein